MDALPRDSLEAETVEAGTPSAKAGQHQCQDPVGAEKTKNGSGTREITQW